MRGSPLLRAAIVLGALLLLLVPLWSFTAPRAQVAVAQAPAARPSAVHLEIVSTKAPFAFSVTHLGKEIWRGESAGESAAADLPMVIPREGVELAVEVEWKAAGTAAARLTLTHGGESMERSLWGDGSAGDVLTFP